MVITCDERQQPSEVLFRDANGNQVSRVLFVRDGAGRLMHEEQYFDQQMPSPFEEVPPEARALLAELLRPSQAFVSIAYEYDQNGRLSSRTERMAALLEERTTFRYDDHGNPVEQTTESDTRTIGIDDEGRMRATSEDARKEQTRFDYSYDAHGNWTERVVWVRDALHSDFRRSNVERRMLSYHEV